jgi:tRNA A-37 threonylcarbamoyl transferase component Bud32
MMMKMTNERWNKIDELLNAAIELEPHKRDAFLDQVCADDQPLRREVSSLIRFRELAKDFMEELPIEIATALRERVQAESGTEVSLAMRPPIYDEASVVSERLGFGVILKDRYIIEKELAHGFSVVYLARDTQLVSRRVVIKLLLERREQSEDTLWYKKKFRQEIEALARIDHPGIVTVLDTGIAPDGRPFLVMQFVEGHSLRSILQPRGMDFQRVANVIRQIGQALSAAHEKGVYHRDLKPENIMLQNFGNGEELVKLIDFGIATIMASQTISSFPTRVVGTLLYMAPEQFEGRVSASSDTYAMGVVAYEMVTGKRPFNPDLPYQLFHLQQAGVKTKPRDIRPSLPEAAQDAILKALSFNPGHRYSQARDFGEELAGALTEHMAMRKRSQIGAVRTMMGILEPVEASQQRPPAELRSAAVSLRIVLLGKRNQQTDEQVLKLLETRLAADGHSVFIDRHLSIGVEWAREIERQLRSADAVIPLLSATSVSSEMIAYTVQVAHEAAQHHQGKPRLLPIRVGYDGSLPDTLAGILDPLRHAVWNGPQDDQHLLAELLTSLRTSETPTPAPHRRKMESVGGAVPLDSEFYIVRPTDEEFHAAIARQDTIVLIKGARQMGKTSLLARGLQQERETGARVVLTDFQKLDAFQLESIEMLLLTLAETLADQLDLEARPDQDWTPRRGASFNFERYLRREVLEKIPCQLVWGLDEVDRLFSHDYGSQIFGLFRSWHNARALDPTGPWQRLTLAIAYATEAHLFITDLNQSPFNVGTRLVLEDFSFEQVAELNQRYDAPLRGTSEVERYMRLVRGHPYLVRRGLHEMATHCAPLATFEEQIDRDEGPFGDHLRRILVLLARDPVLCDAVREVLQGRPCPTQEGFYRLRSAGIISGDSNRDATPRCQLYATYLERHLL